MYYCFIDGYLILKTNDMVEARKQIIKRVERFPKYEWSSHKCYISTDMKGKNKVEDIAYTNKVWLNPNAYPDWASKKKGSSVWREIVVDGDKEWIGAIVPQSVAAMNLLSPRPKKKIVKKM